MILIGIQLAAVPFRSPLNLTGPLDIIAGLFVFIGALVFYARPSRSKLAASAVLTSSFLGWISFFILLIRFYLDGALHLRLYWFQWLLGPLLASVASLLILRRETVDSAIINNRI